MTDGWSRVGEDEIALCEELIAAYHADRLDNAQILLLFRPECPTSNGRTVLAQASLFPEKFKPILPPGVSYHFMIWLGMDRWYGFEPQEKRAIMDHELCHCWMDYGTPKIRAHDIEEFACIIERHGAWYPGLKRVQEAFNPPLLRLPAKVGTMEFEGVRA